VQSRKAARKPNTFSPSPELRGDAASVDNLCYPDRFKLFGKRPSRVDDEALLPSLEHELRHDAESSVWVFLWWTVLAASQETQSVHIDETI